MLLTHSCEKHWRDVLKFVLLKNEIEVHEDSDSESRNRQRGLGAPFAGWVGHGELPRGQDLSKAHGQPKLRSEIGPQPPEKAEHGR